MNRRYIRHPTDIPIAWKLGEVIPPGTEYLSNISEGGLAFFSTVHVMPGSGIEISIPVLHPQLTMEGVVVWCRETDRENIFEVGVRFINTDSHFRMRMVEQVCYIEHFKKTLEEEIGRPVSGEEAAMEWIHRHAHEFPA